MQIFFHDVWHKIIVGDIPISMDYYFETLSRKIAFAKLPFWPCSPVTPQPCDIEFNITACVSRILLHQIIMEDTINIPSDTSKMPDIKHFKVIKNLVPTKYQLPQQNFSLVGPTALKISQNLIGICTIFKFVIIVTGGRAYWIPPVACCCEQFEQSLRQCRHAQKTCPNILCLQQTDGICPAEGEMQTLATSAINHYIFSFSSLKYHKNWNSYLITITKPLPFQTKTSAAPK